MSAVPAGVVPVVPRAGLDPSFQPPDGARCLAEELRTYLLHAGLLAEALGLST